MALETLVTAAIDSGQLLIDKLRQRQFEVTAAFWVKPADEESWFLYIASPVVDRDGLSMAFRTVYRTLSEVPNSWDFTSEIRLIGSSNPITSAVLSAQAHVLGPLSMRYGGRQLGTMLIDEAYIYRVGSLACIP